MVGDDHNSDRAARSTALDSSDEYELSVISRRSTFGQDLSQNLDERESRDSQSISGTSRQ